MPVDEETLDIGTTAIAMGRRLGNQSLSRRALLHPNQSRQVRLLPVSGGGFRRLRRPGRLFRISQTREAAMYKEALQGQTAGERSISAAAPRTSTKSRCISRLMELVRELFPDIGPTST